MNNSYLRNTRWTLRPFRQLLLLLALALPGLSHAQNFTETFGTAVPFETPANADANGRLDNSAAFAFSGASIVSPANGFSTDQYTFTNAVGTSQGASGGASILFGRENPTNTVQVQNAATYNLTIGNINTTSLSSRQRISFGLRIPAAGLAGDIVLEARDGNVGGSTFQNIPFTFPTLGATADWYLISTTAALPSTSNLIVRFRKPGGISTRQYRLDDVTFRAFQPSLVVSISSQLFPNTAVNQRSIPRTLTVTGNDLLGDATVTAPAGYLLRLTGSSDPYEQTAAVTPNANGNASAQFDVIFAPTFASAPGPYPQTIQADITVTSTGATAAAVTVSGNATAPQPILTANPTSLAFGSQAVGTSSAAQSFQLTGQDLSGNVTVSAPVGYEIRVNGQAFSPNPFTLVPVNGAINQSVDVRFVPGTTGAITGNVVATGNGAATASVAVSGSGAPAPVTPTINASPLALEFGTVTNSGSAQTQTFTVSATNLSGPLTLTASNGNIQFRNITNSAGSFTSGPLDIQPNASGNITNQTIEVQLVPTVAQGNFSGTIALTSTGATQVDVAVSGTNTSGAISDISVTDAILREFSTSPATPSAIQSYRISADNLLQDLTILAPQFFQVSLSADPAAPGGFNSLGTATGNSLTLPRVQGSPTPSLNGDIDQTTIYVRYFPPAAQTNRGQVISNSSAPARTQFVSVNGSSEPELNVRGSFAPVINQVKGTPSATQTLVLQGARLNNSVTLRMENDPDAPSTPNPLNPTRTPQFQMSLTADFSDIGTAANPTGFQLTLTPNAQDSLARVPLYVRYAPTRVGQALADILFRTPDINGNVEFNRVPNARLQGRAIDVEPTRQSAATVTRSADGRSVTINFTQEDGSAFPGNPEAAGFGENRLIIASLNPTLGPASFPQDATPYQPGANVYGQGSNINGNFVVFISSGTVATITGLDPNTQYYFFGFENNNDQTPGAENYKTPNLPINVQLPLPVELKSFTAQLRNGQVNLNWVTASEKNNKGFEVQRSQDAREFSTILFKQGNGTTSARSNYDAVDARPLAGLSYYRLKQIDTDGQFSYSPVVTVKSAGLTEASFYPNPTSGKLTVALPQATTAEGLRVRISDLTGRVLREQTLPVTGELDLTTLPAGTYVVTVGTGDQQVTRKVVKN
ncbi:T9SS type A sorting domain-containing protein [Hymenobacter canadensis]|uniref:T9SS type A sorting domain-containing protein n=1 Tax=Hymenobacter canadensis TaxID=2999067 RepID=A0ABY7LXV0_9BACT|nr:T9SS type A sorting domain-containing protein [Hymenobacter canadensis]WBA43575.1 T9SS type A sorting domain-containing protein [Hymenobacter canadensis]